jgi:hypothetical protein
MRFRRRTTVLIAGAAAIVVVAGATSRSLDSTDLTDVAAANPKTVGFNAPNILSPELQEVVWAQGSYKLDGGTPAFPYYGYNGNGPHMPPFNSNVEATKTEPDKNTYLVFNQGLSGPGSNYDYGSHFVYQGHENGVPVALPGAPAGTTVNGSYITRINLDADGAHRVTLLASQTDAGAPLQRIDGSGWDPFAEKPLFTTETAFATVPAGQPPQPSASIYQANLTSPRTSRTSRTSSAAPGSKLFRTTTRATSTSSRTSAARTAQVPTRERASRTASSTASSLPIPRTSSPVASSRRCR